MHNLFLSIFLSLAGLLETTLSGAEKQATVVIADFSPEYRGQQVSVQFVATYDDQENKLDLQRIGIIPPKEQTFLQRWITGAPPLLIGSESLAIAQGITEQGRKLPDDFIDTILKLLNGVSGEYAYAVDPQSWKIIANNFVDQLAKKQAAAVTGAEIESIARKAYISATLGRKVVHTELKLFEPIRVTIPEMPEFVMPEISFEDFFKGKQAELETYKAALEKLKKEEPGKWEIDFSELEKQLALKTQFAEQFVGAMQSKRLEKDLAACAYSLEALKRVLA